MTYDSLRKVIVLFGGLGNSGTLKDTWEWNGTTWTKQTPATSPPARAHHAMAYDAKRQVVVMVGGQAAASLKGTWEWDGKNWVDISATAKFPGIGNLQGHSLEYRAKPNSRLRLFGGKEGGTAYRNYTWELSIP